MKEFRNILVVRTDRMGDVVLTTPALKALREAYPDARISVLVSMYTKAIIEGNPCVDEVWVDDRTNTHGGLRGFWRLVLEIRKRKFDAAVIYHTKRRTNLLCFFAGIPYRLGYKNDKFGFLLTDPVWDERHYGRKHEARYCLDLVRHMGGVSSDILSKSPDELAADLYVSIPPDAEAWVDELLKETDALRKGRLIAVHPGASDPSKRWPEHLFEELMGQLFDRYKGTIILVGTEDTSGAAKGIVSSVRGPVLDLTGKTNVSQLAGLLKRCDLLISNDSGPVHLAAGVGTPVVSIFTRNQPGINPSRWRPLGRKSRVVSVPEDSRMSFRKALPIAPRHMEAVTAQDVLEAVDAIFKLC
jgi:heptosyltransferase-2